MRWLITGASGFLGGRMARLLDARGYEAIAIGGASGRPGPWRSIDLTAHGAAAAVVAETQPNVVVNCAAATNVDACERDPEIAYALNADMAGALARAASDNAAVFVQIYTDQLWADAAPWIEEETPVDPPNVYAASKAEGERRALDAADAIILRTNFFGVGPKWRPSLSDVIASAVRDEGVFPGFTDVFFTPIEVGLLGDCIIAAVGAELRGVFHAGGASRVSKYDFAQRVAVACGVAVDRIRPSKAADMAFHAARPSEMALSTEKLGTALGGVMPSIDQSIHAAFEQESAI